TLVYPPRHRTHAPHTHTHTHTHTRMTRRGHQVQGQDKGGPRGPGGQRVLPPHGREFGRIPEVGGRGGRGAGPARAGPRGGAAARRRGGAAAEGEGRAR